MYQGPYLELLENLKLVLNSNDVLFIGVI